MTLYLGLITDKLMKSIKLETYHYNNKLDSIKGSHTYREKERRISNDRY